MLNDKQTKKLKTLINKCNRFGSYDRCVQIKENLVNYTNGYLLIRIKTSDTKDYILYLNNKNEFIENEHYKKTYPEIDSVIPDMDKLTPIENKNFINSIKYIKPVTKHKAIFININGVVTAGIQDLSEDSPLFNLGYIRDILTLIENPFFYLTENGERLVIQGKEAYAILCALK
jgi:hypothetical protein